jgi:acid phosphatase
VNGTVLGVSLLLAVSLLVNAQPSAVASSASTSSLKHLVIIYMENHSFDNLYGLWGPVNGGVVHGQTNGHNTQLGQDGTVLSCVDQNDVNLQHAINAAVPAPSCTDTHHTVPDGATFMSSFGNDQFNIGTYIPSSATTCSKANGSSDVAIGTGNAGGCTRDLVHRFYQEQYQIDRGNQDRYVAGSDAQGLVLGYYDTTQLPLWQFLHQTGPYTGTTPPNYIVHDNFFQGAFGGSFANHQALVAGQLPIYTAASASGTTSGCGTGSTNCDLHSVVDANGMPNNSSATPAYAYYSPAGAVKDQALTEAVDANGNCVASYPTNAVAPPKATLCGDYAVNTIQPFTQPYSPGTQIGRRLPTLTTDNIGDEMTNAGVSWGYFAGGWANAAAMNGSDANHPLSKGWTAGTGTTCANANVITGATYPYCADALFQFHHQPFGYYSNYADGTLGRAQHLKDEQDLINETDSTGADLATYTMAAALPQVSFIKPIGEDNEHPGYTGTLQGEQHLVKIIQALLGPTNPDAANTAVFVTYDEFGGQYDHVAPPGARSNSDPSDAFGPGTRIPAITIANPALLATSSVDHASNDTISLLSVIESTFSVPAVQAEPGSIVTTLRDVREAGASKKLLP